MTAPPIHFARATDGASIACTSSGDGPPLIVCASLATTLGYTPPPMTPLLDHFTTGNLDRRGFGHSSRDHSATMELFVQDILGVADHVGFDAFHLVGYSMGALESIATAIDAPTRVRGLVLHAPFPPDWYTQPRSRAWLAALDADWNWFCEAWTRTWGGPGQPATLDMIENFKRANDPGGFRAAVQAFIAAPVAEVSKITIPTVVIHRTAKWQVQTVAEAYARAIPGAELIVDYSPDVFRVSPETELRLQEFFVRTLPPDAIPQSWLSATREPLDDVTIVRLSVREREVLRLLTNGCSNRQIAEALSLSVLTAARHVHNIYAKLNVQNRAAAAAWAAQHGMA